MSNPIPINLAVEGLLDEVVLSTILEQSGIDYHVGRCFSGRGYGYLRKNIRGFNNAAKGTPFLLLTDLDRCECAPLLIREWLPIPKHNNLIFRIAVREVESWILAHQSAFADYLGIQKDLVPENPDDLEDPKEKLIELAEKSRKRTIRESIVPQSGNMKIEGPNYSVALADFVVNYWKVTEAIKSSPSLDRAFNRITAFRATWNTR